MTKSKKKKLIRISVVIVLCVLFAGYEIDRETGFFRNFIYRKMHAVQTTVFSFDQVPDYDGTSMYVTVNNNVPFFTETDITTESFETYSDLDELGRCGTAFANISREIMPLPNEIRGNLNSITPSGYRVARYPELIEDVYLYNRCHLIAYTLAGENDNRLNLITGTNAFNKEEGMEQFELQVSYYVKSTNHHVLYRVTPYFYGAELVARGVLIEAKSVEDDNLQFCVFVYNVQPGITINYLTGESLENIRLG